ncbi:MAG: ATP-binding protein [Myxococcales bacterium]|nr:ATP-binding protein [Myxococcales bacterium]MCB9581704.1 ATP-binding protein [Polyangiaceae bacterium]
MLKAPFPSRPQRLVGRASELSALRRLLALHPTRVALVGGGGSGKTTLARELAHRTHRKFKGGVHWFRVGDWDERVLAEMIALRLGSKERRLADVARLLRQGESRLLVLDNHENDEASAALLDAVGGDAPVSFVVTARRCLVAGVHILPVVPPLVLAERPPFPRVARLTRPLRSNPVALQLADALVAERVVTASALSRWLSQHGIGRVRALAHEDDVPEVALLVRFAWSTLNSPARRALAVLTHMGGDHMDRASLMKLAPTRGSSLERLRALRLVEEPVAGRFTLHATVRHALGDQTSFDMRALFEHYLALLERDPSRRMLEEQHLFAAMDYAHDAGRLDDVLRVERLLASFGS